MRACVRLCVVSLYHAQAEGVGVGGLKEDKVQALFDPQPTYYAEVLYSEGNYL